MLVTALITPFQDGAARLDLSALKALVAFQLEQGVDQVLLFGTTGEGAALSEAERCRVLAAALEVAAPERLMVSIGPGAVDQLLSRGRAALAAGVADLLLVDCPYAGPSSASLRLAWHGPVAAALPTARLFPYAVPSRTGTELLPEDLARLIEDHPNVVGVKDATGRLARMARVRSLCGERLLLLCGDDGHLARALVDPAIAAQGGCSVAGNLAPAAMARLVAAGRAGEAETLEALNHSLRPLFELVSVRSEEPLRLAGEWRDVPQLARNPAPLKQALNELGLPGGGCRAPHAPLGERAREQVRVRVEQVLRRSPELLAPISGRFSDGLLARGGSACG